METTTTTTTKKDEGFTLIELLIVIVILGILSAIVVFSVNGITNRGSQSACQANVETVNIASEAFRAQNTAYAASLTALQTAGFLKTIPGTVAGDAFTVSPGGGNAYRITYSPTTGAVTATSGAGFATAGCPSTN
jgi:prepilin-type N-terminal cleavage/methylation domain-containing protein